MKITLIGMSGVGKSHVAAKLEKKGFVRYSTDEFIEEKLQGELRQYGYEGLADISRWMGQPYELRYSERSRRYLDLERKSMEEIIRIAKSTTRSENVVIDTTGSLIYLDTSVLAELTRITTIIYMQTSPMAEADMFNTYINDPKPVIWGDSFRIRNDESEVKALARCYPTLLAARKIKYEKLANIIVDYKKFRELKPDSVYDFIINSEREYL